MPKLPVRVHQSLDFLTVVGFAAAPTALGFTGLPATVAYVLSAVHLVVTLLTRYTVDGRAPIPFALHGLIELAVTPVLVLLPLLLGWTEPARTFYLVTAAIFGIVWILTDYTRPIARPM